MGGAPPFPTNYTRNHHLSPRFDLCLWHSPGLSSIRTTSGDICAVLSGGFLNDWGILDAAGMQASSF